MGRVCVRVCVCDNKDGRSGPIKQMVRHPAPNGCMRRHLDLAREYLLRAGAGGMRPLLGCYVGFRRVFVCVCVCC